MKFSKMNQLPRRLNQQFRIVLQPKPGIDPKNRRRFAVGAYSLDKYVGEYNAVKALNRAIKYQKKDILSISLPKHGKIQFYFSI